MKAFLDKLRHAFAVGPDPAIRQRDLPAVLERLAREVVARRLETPAIIFLEGIRPLNFMASQTLFAAWPLVQLAGGWASYREVAECLEDRETLHRLALRIEELSVSGARP